MAGQVHPAARFACGVCIAVASCAAVSCGPEREVPPVPTMPAAGQATQSITHAIIGRWTYPIDGHAGFVREFRSDGSMTAWWPDGRVAGRGSFFVVGTNAAGVEYSNKDTEVVLLAESNLLRIAHVQHAGYHFKFIAQREIPTTANTGLFVAPPRTDH